MLVDVALPLPLPRTFAYDAATANGGERLLPAGTRVLVPFGRRRLIGWVTGREAREPERGAVREVLRVLDRQPTATPELLRLCEWIAGYYHAPLGQVLRTALPAVLSDPRRPEPPLKTRRVLRLTRRLPTLLEREQVFGRAHRQQACYDVLEASGGAAELTHLLEAGGFSRGVLDGLVAKGVAEFIDAVLDRDPFVGIAVEPPPELTPTADQAAVLGRLRSAVAEGAPAPIVLRGVTGSGKTLVYIELLRDVVERRGRSAIVLVPEISLTPQTVARFRARFGDTIAVLHSALSDGERYDAWRALRDGQRRIAIGARSAVFAPVPDLGAIIVDEEHESSYKQAEAPRYHARDVAVVRAKLAGAVCLLGSATPSLESWANTVAGKFRLLELPVRVEGWPLPPVQVLDLREARKGERGAPKERQRESERERRMPVIITDALRAALEARLQRREQAILLLNRRGYATFVQCRECGHVWHCADCNVSLTYHRTRRRLLCHYCSRQQALPRDCEECRSDDIAYRGIGTEQVERSVGELVPAARIARMDVDTTGGKWAHHEILGRVERGEVDILLGTQMIAKGLDFPRVTLVGVINADVGMNLPDFRASERTFQLLTQVAGRAGRGPLGGEVLIQTALPGHYAIRCAIGHDFAGFVAQELEERRQPPYPPHARLINIVASGVQEEPVARAAEDAAAWVRGRVPAGVELLGPAPCAIDRIRGRWRWHFLLRSSSAAALGELGRAFHAEFPQRSAAADIRYAIDRDPVHLL
ncbi:MAG: replication restart helicase PriA [Longimicrobiales bacterium]